MTEIRFESKKELIEGIKQSQVHRLSDDRNAQDLDKGFLGKCND
jgi:hypothetical protein